MSEHHFWTPERIENLRRLWDAGLSAGEISNKWNGAVSRSAVLGKVHRLGIQRAPTTQHVRAKRSTKVKTAGQTTVVARELHTSVVYGRAAKPSLRTFVVDAVTDIADTPAPAHQRKSIETLTPTCCRWPVGEPGTPDFHFCGGGRLPGLSYCLAHAQRAYRAVPVKSIEMDKQKDEVLP